MPANVIKEWATTHGPSAAGRVVKRMERFAQNTLDETTAAAAADLVELIKKELP